MEAPANERVFCAPEASSKVDKACPLRRVVFFAPLAHSLQAMEAQIRFIAHTVDLVSTSLAQV
jgi:hypothetical protein